MTGIGNYCFHLLDALIGAGTEFEFRSFGQVRWHDFDAASLREIKQRKNKDQDAARPTIAHRLAAQLRVYATRSSLAQASYRSMRMISFAGTVSRQSLDLFHALSFLPPADPGVPSVPVVYDLSFVRYPATHPKARLKALERLPSFIAKAPLVQTISEFSRNEIASVYGYPSEKIFIAPPAPAAIFRPLGMNATRQGLASFDLEPQRYLLAVGTLEPRKNLGMLVAAYSCLTSFERLRTPLVIAGGAGWGDVGLPKQASALVREGSLYFLGMVPDARLRDLYEGAVALLFPSIYEGFGMPVVEAMSCGTRVIHSAGTSMDEISADLGTRLPATDVTAWTEAMRRSIETTTAGQTADPDRQRRIAQARTFDWTTGAERVRAAYRRLLT